MRIPEASQRNRREGKQAERKDEGQADEFLQALYNCLVQPMTIKIDRKPQMPEINTPQIFTGTDKTLF
jgi:hypothetical protein